MKIIILGAGEVGSTLAQHLVNENNDITIIDKDINRLRELQDKFDLRVIQGQASHPSALKDAGAQDADMLVAVTSNDETNMIACQIAYSLYNTPNRIARIRSPEYIEERKRLFQPDAIPIDYLITPERLLIDYVQKLLEYPGALQVVDFAQNRVKLVCVKAFYGGPLIGNSISTLKEHMPYIDVRIVAIYRKDQAIRPQGSTIIEAGDEVFFITENGNIRTVISELQRLEKPYKRIMILGGGNVGAGLAARIENTYNVKLIEKDFTRAEALSEQLEKTTVFCGDASDQELLNEEHIDQTDVFITLTNDDEANIMSSMLAKKMGVKRAIVLIQRSVYVDLMQENFIDVTISPQLTTISALLTHVRRGDIVNVSSLRKGVAEAIEIIAHGDAQTSQVIGKRFTDLKLPLGITIGAIVRNNEVIIGKEDTIIQQNDHVIMFLLNKKHVPEIERLFQPNALFL